MTTMAAAPAIAGVTLVLEGSKDWDEWISTIRMTAEAREVKELVNIHEEKPRCL